MTIYSTKKILSDYEINNKIILTDIIKFKFNGVSERDVYNLTAPTNIGGELILAARVEPRENHDSLVYLFHEVDGQWYPHPDWEPIELEDPFFFRIGEKILMGAVKTFLKDDEQSLGWYTVVYDISDFMEPKEVFRGPQGMKDLRFIEYSDKRIGVFTRPQGNTAGRGTCGYFETDSLENLNPRDLSNSELISSPDKDSWEGINQPFIINDDFVGLLGHIAWMEESGVRHYYAAVSEFKRKTLEKTEWRIIAQRSDFPKGPAKRADLVDVLFPGGMDLINNKEAILYVGLSDTEAWKCIIQNPF